MNSPAVEDPTRRALCRAVAAAAAVVAVPCRAQVAAPMLEVGVLPNISARALLGQYEPMRAYLARELARGVQVSTAPDWATFHQRTLSASYDLVVTASHLARLAQLDRGYQPLLNYAPDIKGLLVVPQARPLREPADLRGRTLALSNPQSLVTLRGMRWLAESGLQRDRDFRTIGAAADDSVGALVVRGDAAAAMLSGGEFRAIPEATRAQLQVLSTFAEVPGFVLLASPRMPVAETRLLRDTLLRFGASSEEGKAFFAATGFTAIREPAARLMESMDEYVEPTRRMFAA